MFVSGTASPPKVISPRVHIASVMIVLPDVVSNLGLVILFGYTTDCAEGDLEMISALSFALPCTVNVDFVELPISPRTKE